MILRFCIHWLALHSQQFKGCWNLMGWVRRILPLKYSNVPIETAENGVKVIDDVSKSDNRLVRSGKVFRPYVASWHIASVMRRGGMSGVGSEADSHRAVSAINSGGAGNADGG